MFDPDRDVINQISPKTQRKKLYLTCFLPLQSAESLEIGGTLLMKH